MKSLGAWIGGATLFGALFADRDAVLWMVLHREAFFPDFMVFLTDFGMLFAVALFGIALVEKHRVKQVILITLALLMALEASYLLKIMFRVPRPYEIWDFEPLVMASGYSFPSMHAAFIFAALPFFRARAVTGRLLGKRTGWVFWSWAGFAGVVALSRVVVGVHTVSDVVAGGLIGYGTGTLLRHWEDRYDLSGRVSGHFKNSFEVRRQAAHAFIGLSILLLYHFDLLSPGIMLGILVVGGGLSLLSMAWEVPGLRFFLDWFERPHHRRLFPGRGSFFMVLGSLLAMVLFPKETALAAIAIMALGDSVTSVFGRYFGEVKLPYNPKKTMDGALMGVGVATLGAFFFVPFSVALVASAAAMFVETLDLKWGGMEFDDNVLVPLVAGGVMVLM